MLLARGHDLKAVSAMLGHSRVDTTLRVYDHVSPELTRRMVADLPGLGEKKNSAEP
jgi:site-specific recombinase XerD